MVGMEDGIFPSHMTISYGDDGRWKKREDFVTWELPVQLETTLSLTCAQAEDDPWRDSV